MATTFEYQRDLPTLYPEYFAKFTPLEQAIITRLQGCSYGKTYDTGWRCDVCGYFSRRCGSLKYHIMTEEACGGSPARKVMYPHPFDTHLAILAAVDWKGVQAKVELWVHNTRVIRVRSNTCIYLTVR